jgi:hypothetical protein
VVDDGGLAQYAFLSATERFTGIKDFTEQCLFTWADKVGIQEFDVKFEERELEEWETADSEDDWTVYRMIDDSEDA